MIRLGILATHPIQYHAPLFRYLASSSEVESIVYFCHRPTPTEQGEGFGVTFEWDIDLTAGYPHVWLKNQSSRPSLISFSGCDTPEIAHIIQEEQFDAFMIHGWNIKSSWQAILACWRKGIPILVRGDSQIEAQHSVVKRMFKRLLYPLFISRFSVCLATGQRSAEYFRHYKAHRVEIAPHFVDNRWFAERAADARRERVRIRSRWGFDRDTYLFLFAGKFEPKKRPFDVVTALDMTLRAGIRNVGLVMVGDGALRSKCQEVARDAGLPIHFTGFQNQTEMPSAYAVSDCLVMTSDARETWGLAVNEAMACGLPALVSDEVGCVPDLIIQGQTGHSYLCEDISALSGYMTDLARDPVLTRSLGGSALAHVQQYSVDSAANIILRSVQGVTAGRRG
jgi:glycosyltransferase involved in cell wall biosynthesis